MSAGGFDRSHCYSMLDDIEQELGGAGALPGALADVRRSARLGPKMADWLEQNAERLCKHPLLQAGNKGGGGAPKGAAGKASSQGTPPRHEPVADAAEKAGGAGKKALRTAEQLLGKSEDGPGTWQTSPKRSGGADYQEQITGVQRGLEYDVPLSSAPSGKVSFGGYDAERKVLLDGKDWKRYPPKDEDFWKKETVKQAKTQIKAANGLPVEWHFSTQSNLEPVQQLFDVHKVNGIALVLTPPH